MLLEMTALVSSGVLNLFNTTIEGNTATIEGGALAIDGGSVLLTNQSLLLDNKAPVGALAVVAKYSALYYGLPAPLSHWIVAPFECKPYRQPCPQGATSCDPDKQPLFPVQQCDWQANPVSLGMTMVSLGAGVHDDDHFPLVCPATTYSDSLEIAVQSRPTCSGACPAGFYCDKGTVTPFVCTEGNYCPAGVAAPVGCPAEFSTSPIGSTSAADCLCKAAYYNNATAGDPLQCLSSPIGTDRTMSGQTLETLTLSPGHWRPSLLSIDVRRCPDAGANCSEKSSCVHSSSACHMSGAGLASQRELCLPGLTGVFCKLCKDENNTYYRKATSERVASCEACKDTLAQTIGIGIGGLLGALVLVTLLYRWWHRLPAMRKAKEQLFRVQDTYTLQNKGKIMIGFYMIASKLDNVYELRMPEEVRDVYLAVSRVLTLGIEWGLELTPLECFGLGAEGYAGEMAFWLIVPCVLEIIIVIGAAIWLAVRTEFTLGRLIPAVAPLSLRMLFLLYPLVTRKAFEAWSFYEFVEGDFLRADVSLRKGSPEYSQAESLAILAILLYPVGTLVFFGALLFGARHAIHSGQPTTLFVATRFLHGEYEARYYWWELAEMGRRFLLVGVLVVVPAQGTIEQLAYGSMIALLYLALQTRASPFKRASDDFLAIACSLLLSVFFLCAILYKYAELTDVHDLYDVMSPEQRTDYRPPFVALVTVLTFTSVGAFVFLALIIFVQWVDEMRRQRREARAARARRLRYSSVYEDRLSTAEYTRSGKEVEPPPLSEGAFHVFLSHTWAQGEEAMRTVKLRLQEMMPHLRVFLDKDDLKTGAGAEYIDVSSVMLCFCTQKYFQSRACARELFRAQLQSKPLIAVLEPDQARGGLSIHEIKAVLTSAHYAHFGADDSAAADQTWDAQWRLDNEMAAWDVQWSGSGLGRPTGEAIAASLFRQPALEWNRLSAFQDVTMRHIAERLLPEASRGTVYVQDEMSSLEVPPMTLPRKHKYHLFCSRSCAGAAELADEINRELGTTIKWTANRDELHLCARLLLYLTGKTWTSGEASAAFVQDVSAAQALGVPLLLVHEAPSALEADAVRSACPFNDFWNDGWTPKHLLTGSTHVYKQIATALKPDVWRKAGLATVALKLAEAQPGTAEGEAPSQTTTARGGLKGAVWPSRAPKDKKQAPGGLCAPDDETTWQVATEPARGVQAVEVQIEPSVAAATAPQMAAPAASPIDMSNMMEAFKGFFSPKEDDEPPPGPERPPASAAAYNLDA